MTDLLQRVEQNIRKHGLFKRSEKILVAVSGGLDSMALLQVLNELSARHRWKIIVAHFNHRVRGRASDADEKLVMKTAAAMRLRFIAERADVKAFTTKSKLSLEMAARKLRHEFFARAAKQNKIEIVALAHHADDQVELFFLRLLRGAGGEGLAGMKWRSSSPVDSKIRLVRPLLGFSKSELAEFVRENKIQFRDDSTNCSTDIFRNRIRNKLLPLLRRNYQTGLDKTVLRLMDIVGMESEFVGDTARRWLKQRKPDFESLPVAVQRRVLQCQLMALGIVTDFGLVERLCRSVGKFVSVSPNLSVAREQNGMVKLRTRQPSKFNANELVVNLAGRAGGGDFGGVKFTWHFRTGSEGRSPRQIQREFFDAEKVGGKIVLRHWQAGDRFQPIGLKSSVKLQDLFTNAKIPSDRRRKLILAESSGEEIFWVEGLRIGENFKLTPRTKGRLAWNWHRQLP